MEHHKMSNRWSYQHDLHLNTRMVVSPVKRRIRDRDESEEKEEWVEIGKGVKRFLSEEMMANHMQQLNIASPPYYSPSHECGEFASGSEDDILNTNCIRFDDLKTDDDFVLAKPLCEDVKILCDGLTEDSQEELVVKSNGKFKNVDKDMIEDDTSDENITSSDFEVWIAPEMKDIMQNSKSILPDDIMNEMNKPCMALVPYMKPEEHLIHSIWKSINTQTSSEIQSSCDDHVTNDTSSICDDIRETSTSSEDLLKYKTVNSPSFNDDTSHYISDNDDTSLQISSWITDNLSHYSPETSLPSQTHDTSNTLLPQTNDTSNTLLPQTGYTFLPQTSDTKHVWITDTFNCYFPQSSDTTFHCTPWTSGINGLQDHSNIRFNEYSNDEEMEL